MTPFDPKPAENPRAVRGGNRPPIAEFYKEQNETLPQYLADDNADIVARVDELEAAMARAPSAVNDDDTAGKISDFIAQIGKCAKQAEAKRVDAKAGPLTAGRLIDGFFSKQIADRLSGMKNKLTPILTAYERAKADAERRRREAAEAEARKAAEEAARMAAELAAELATPTDLDTAIAAEDAARAAQEAAAKAAEAAAARPAEMATVRGDYGSSSSLRTVWKGRPEKDYDGVDLNGLREFIGQDAIDKAINACARAHKGTKPVRGVVFFEDSTAVVRG